VKGGRTLEISEKKVGEVNVVNPCGRLDAYAANDVERKLNSFTDTAQVCLVVNLEKLEYISSAGLRVLIATLKKARKQQGDVRLTCLQPYVKDVFDISGFTQLFQIFDKEEEAVNSFKKS
jgi:anti-sigma B factor antagonist